MKESYSFIGKTESSSLRTEMKQLPQIQNNNVAVTLSLRKLTRHRHTHQRKTILWEETTYRDILDFFNPSRPFKVKQERKQKTKLNMKRGWEGRPFGIHREKTFRRKKQKFWNLNLTDKVSTKETEIQCRLLHRKEAKTHWIRTSAHSMAAWPSTFALQSQAMLQDYNKSKTQYTQFRTLRKTTVSKHHTNNQLIC